MVDLYNILVDFYYISSINPFVSLHNKLIEAGLLYFRHIDLLTKEE